ncbi:MAG TPA: mevalonate kinase [Desulfobacterales bacterium]
MPVSATAPGKLILLGEYAVLAGAPALVAAVDRRVRVEIRPNGRESTLTLARADIDGIAIDGCGGGLQLSKSPTADPQIGSILGILDFFCRTTGQDAEALAMELTVDAGGLFSGDGSKYGFGSSAALSVALLAALHGHMGRKSLRAEDLLTNALQAHRSQQGRLGSGIDVAASVFGGILEYRLKAGLENQIPQIRRVHPPPGLYMRAVWTGQSASTFQMLSGLDRFRLQDPEAYRSAIGPLVEITRQGLAAFAENDHHEFIDTVNRFYRQLIAFADRSGLPIVTPYHECLAFIAEKLGGAYKPSGAGGGDVGLVFTDSEEKMARIVTAMQVAGFEILDLRWGDDGVELMTEGAEHETTAVC